MNGTVKVNGFPKKSGKAVSILKNFMFQNHFSSTGSSPKKTLDPKRARELVEEIFTTKLQEKEEEVELISQRIKEIQHSLQLVRYGAVSAMSNQTQIHVRGVA